VAQAIAKGYLPPLGRCVACTNDAVHYHHFSYEKVHWLHVVPLCISCHRLVHHGHEFAPVTAMISALESAPEIIVPRHWDTTPRKTEEEKQQYHQRWYQENKLRLDVLRRARQPVRPDEPHEYFGFIEILPGLFYEEATGYPWSTRSNGEAYKKPIKRIVAQSHGYTCVKVNGKMVKWHRLVWEFFNNAPIPNDMVVDHADNNQGNNKMSNLQLLSVKENVSKCRVHRDNSSGYPGVCWAAREKKFLANIKINGVTRHLGYFSDPEAAYKAFLKAKIQYSGEASVAPLHNLVIKPGDD
jgi:sulfur relay (sulfurtransferase) DsrC/TusE family protein